MFPLGMEIDFTNSDRVKSDPKTNSPELCPVPLVYILSSDGNLLVYNCVDTVLVGKDRACEAMKPAEKLPGLKPTAVSASFVNPPGSKLPGNVTTGLKVDAQSEKPAFQWGFAPDPSAPATKPSPPPPTSMFSNIALKSNIPVSSFGNGAPVDPFTIVNSPSEAATKPVFGGLFSTALSSTSLPSTVAFTNPPAVTGPSFPLFGNPASSEGSKPAIPSQMSFSNPSASQPVASAPPLFGVKAAEVGTKPATIVAKPADTTAAKPSFGVPSFGFSNSPGTEAKSAFGTELGNGPRPLLSKPNPLVKGDASSASSSPFGAGKSVFDSVAASPSPVPSLKPVPSVSAPPAPSPPKLLTTIHNCLTDFVLRLKTS
ncbi:hypothetical protein BC830DRAFT_609262 [Chytriomyces sp. MP71]|nr:hypothetical protein BC830DRAFT_609262 [Chytriomyces sp. MP71]